MKNFNYHSKQLCYSRIFEALNLKTVNNFKKTFKKEKISYYSPPLQFDVYFFLRWRQSAGRDGCERIKLIIGTYVQQ